MRRANPPVARQCGILAPRFPRAATVPSAASGPAVRPSLIALPVFLVLFSLLAGCNQGGVPAAAPATSPPASAIAASTPGADPTVIAAGDIGDCSIKGVTQTAALVE